MSAIPSFEPISGDANQDMDRASKIAALRQLVMAKERDTRSLASPHHTDQANWNTVSHNAAFSSPDSSSPWHFGLSDIDAALPRNRLRMDAVHEIAGAAFADTTTASAYVFALLNRLNRLSTCSTPSAAPVLWCQSFGTKREYGAIHGAGLGAFGLDTEQFLLVTAARNRDVLWALEEGARSSSLLAVIGEVDRVSFTQTRRLALAAIAGKTPVLLVRQHHDLSASAAETRWRITAATGTSDPFVPNIPGNPRWHIELVRCRAGQPGAWIVEWDYETHCFHLVEQFSDRSLKTPRPLISFTDRHCA